MKRIIIVNICINVSYFCMGQTPIAVQASPSNLNAPANAQPVPNSNTTERGAPTARPLIEPAANPVPPIYPGAEARSFPTQQNLIYPASPSAPTQPVQKEPLSPIEATNTLQPTRAFRDEQSRSLSAIGLERKVISPVTRHKTETVKKGEVKTYPRTPKANGAVYPVRSDVTPSISSKEAIAMKMDGSASKQTEKQTDKKTKPGTGRKH